MKYRAFVFYRCASSHIFAENLELALKAYAKPFWKSPMATFRDEKYLRPGIDLPGMIQDALENSEVPGAPGISGRRGIHLGSRRVEPVAKLPRAVREADHGTHGR